MTGRFHFGDRVRLGAMRGCLVLPVDGRLRAVSPDGRLHWLDFFVPDEGPDGRIFPNTWDTCAACGNPTKGDILCRNCDNVGNIRPAGSPDACSSADAQRAYQAAIFWALPPWAQSWLQVKDARRSECDRHAPELVAPTAMDAVRRG